MQRPRVDISVLAPAGFPGCLRCPYLALGDTDTCFECASRSLTAPARPCPVCGGERTTGTCHNQLCHERSRALRRVSAVFVKSPLLASRIRRLKDEGRREWAVVFGTILCGWLRRHRRPEDYDLVVANPTCVTGSSGRRVPHTELVIDAADACDPSGEWSFDVAKPRALVKIRPTARSRGTQTDKERAADQLYGALSVPDPRRIQGSRVLIYDDICTTGLQLDRLARFLLGHGARSAEGVVLARTPWTARAVPPSGAGRRGACANRALISTSSVPNGPSLPSEPESFGRAH